MKHLIVGHGSIGKRHEKNLQRIGEKVVLFNRQKELFHNKVKQVDSVFITCPTAYHMVFALEAAKAGKHIFVEKPISDNIDKVRELFDICDSNGKVCYVGYNLRFNKNLIEIREDLEKLGRIFFVKAEVGEYLPGWHIDEDYRKGYAARSDMGGGVVLTLSHEIDYIRWLFGEIRSVKAFTGKVSNLDIDVEDTACIIMKSNDGVLIELHMDYIQEPAVRTMKIQGEFGVINWDYYSDKSFDRNQMFLDEVVHFIACCQKNASPLVTKEEVIDVMNIIEKIKRD